MSLIDNVTQFNQLTTVLPALQGFIGVLQAGRITINTDGSGHYWAVVPQYNQDTGSSSPNAIIPLSIVAGLATASSALATLLTYVNNAAVNPPPAGAIPS